MFLCNFVLILLQCTSIGCRNWRIGHFFYEIAMDDTSNNGPNPCPIRQYILNYRMQLAIGMHKYKAVKYWAPFFCFFFEKIVMKVRINGPNIYVVAPRHKN